MAWFAERVRACRATQITIIKSYLESTFAFQHSSSTGVNAEAERTEAANTGGNDQGGAKKAEPKETKLEADISDGSE